MKTYQELQRRLISIGFKDISRNYSGGCGVLHLGYGHNNDPWPAHQVRVFRTQEGGFRQEIYFQDWLEVSGQPRVRVRNLEQIWATAFRLAETIMKGTV